VNILVIKQSALGDVLHATAAIRNIRAAYPDARITVLTSPGAAQLYQHNQQIDRIILFDKDRLRREWKSNFFGLLAYIRQVMREVNQQSYDLAFDLQGLARSVIFLYAADARDKWVKGNWWMLGRFRQKELHAIDEMNRLLEKAGVPAPSRDMLLNVGDEDRRTVESLLQRINPEGKKLLILAPFTRWPTKEWGLDNFLRLINRLPDDVLPVFTGAPVNRAAVDSLTANRAVNLAGELSLLQFAELMRRADAAVTSDSFPMHLASAMNTPLVALFGPTDESRVGPLSVNATIMRADVGCTRCYKRDYCEKACIRAISVDQVLRCVEDKLQLAQPSASEDNAAQISLSPRDS